MTILQSVSIAEIRLELCKDEKKIANYFLYVNEDKEFIDEFLY